MSIHRYTYPDGEQAAHACARHILSALEETLAGESDATLAVSGGATPRPMFAELARHRFSWEHVQLFFVDERCVPPTSEQSNYRLVEECFIAPAHFPRRNVHRIQSELRPEAAAERYAEEIRTYFGLGPGELPHFDIIHRGIGADCHTASLFPGERLIEDRERVAAAVYVDKLEAWRVTMLPGVLLNARHTVMLVSGTDKAGAVRDVFAQPYDAVRYPAQLSARHGRSVTWFVDEAAAARMD